MADDFRHGKFEANGVGSKGQITEIVVMIVDVLPTEDYAMIHIKSKEGMQTWEFKASDLQSILSPDGK